MSERQESGQERTEEPTPRRLQQAREKAQVPRSRELNTMAILLAGAVALDLLGGHVIERLAAIFEKALTFDRQLAFEPGAMLPRLGDLVLDGLIAITPLAIVLFIVALLAPMSLGGVAFSAKALAPKWEKLNPVKGLGRVFGPQGLMEFLKALGKFVVVTVAAAVVLWSIAGDIVDLTNYRLTAALGRAAHLGGWTFIVFASVLIVIAAIDVPFQLWQHTRRLRMTRQEVKDDMKDTEGRPEVRARIRQVQREMAQRRMMDQVPGADVVVTNPTHYAVALRYERDHRAPRVVAKGVDQIARTIRARAAEHGVECIEAAPLARALYQSTELEQEIPAALFVAVAQILAHVYQLEAARSAGNTAPELPDSIPVPPGMDPEKQRENN